MLSKFKVLICILLVETLFFCFLLVCLFYLLLRGNLLKKTLFLRVCVIFTSSRIGTHEQIVPRKRKCLYVVTVFGFHLNQQGVSVWISGARNRS
jgi:hypothetical protein